MKPFQISGKLHLSLNACLFGLFFLSNTTQAVSPLSDEQLSEQQASILPTKTVVVKKKKPACVNSADKEQVELEKAKDKRGNSCSGENALSAKSKKDESDNEKQLSANKSDDESDAASNSQVGDDTHNGLSAQKDKSLADESNDNATNDSDLNLLSGNESIKAFNNGTEGSSLADAGKMLSAAGLPAGFLDANGNILDPSALERLNTLEAFNLNATDVDKDALQRLLNLQNLQVNTGPDGSTAITLKDTEYESGYIYESITGGGINKGDDIEIPSIRAGLNEVKVIAK